MKRYLAMWILTLVACNNSSTNKKDQTVVTDSLNQPADTDLHLMKGFELYVWEKGDATFYNLLPGTNRIKKYEEIHDTSAASKDLISIQKKIDQIAAGEYIFLKAFGVDTNKLKDLKDYIRSKDLNLNIITRDFQ